MVTKDSMSLIEVLNYEEELIVYKQKYIEYRAVKVMHETRIPKGFYEMDFVFIQRFSNEYYINKRDYTLISRKQYQTLSQSR